MKRENNQKLHTGNAGFTLIEVMVSVMIFSLIMVMGLGALLTSSAAYKETRGEGVVIDNLAFVLESAARKIRTGQRYSCEEDVATNCSTGGSEAFYFTDQDGNRVSYILKSDASGRGYVERSISGGLPQMLTDPEEINISSLVFFLEGVESPSDGVQPFVTLTLSGTSYVAGVQTDFSLQTSVTQRLLDVPVISSIL
jgi:prepilin-type N-terminal cleavage/methylation domain-containing protein